MTETFKPEVNDYLEDTMVTDTKVYHVTRVSETSIWIIPCVEKENGSVWREKRDGNPYPVVWTEVEPAMEETPKRLVRRKDGSFRVANWAHPLRPATLIMGKPVSYTDYRM